MIMTIRNDRMWVKNVSERNKKLEKMEKSVSNFIILGLSERIWKERPTYNKEIVCVNARGDRFIIIRIFGDFKK